MIEHDIIKAYQALHTDFSNLLNSFSALKALSSLDLRQTNEPALLRKALQGLLENFEISRCSIFLLDNDNLTICTGLDLEDLLATDDVSPAGGDGPPATTFHVGEGIMGLAVRRRTIQHCHDCRADSHFITMPGQKIGSLISAPIFQIGGEVLGVLNVSHPEPNAFTQWHERFLSVFCHFVGQLLINYRLVHRMDNEIEKRTAQLSLALKEAHSAQQSLELFKTIIESFQEAVSIHDADENLLYINPAFERLFGLTLEEAQRAGMSGCFTPESNQILERLMLPSIHRGKDWEGEVNARNANGESFPVVIHAGAVRDGEGKALFTFRFIRDIREQRENEKEKKILEAQLHHAQRMEAIGQLAGGVAHDFNNIITAITGYAHLLSLKMGRDDPLRHYAEQITAAAERAANVTRGLLAFSRKESPSSQPVEVNKVIKAIHDLLARLIGEDIDFKVRTSRESLVVMADRSRLEQVVMNLVTNARDALTSGGSITLSTGLVHITDQFIQLHGFGTEGKYACISVADTGIGMDASVKEKIFEPFYTTKEVGRGTGLGLSIVYGIVKQFDGFIDVQSEPGKGTRFRIFLPLHCETSAGIQSAPPITSPTGKGTILLAEDDLDVRSFTVALLQEFGYRVIEAVDGMDALDTFLRRKDEIDLVILDVVMPRMNGKEVLEKLKQIRTDTKILFTSGYTPETIARQGILEKEAAIIKKPYSPGELLKKIAELIQHP